MPPARLALSVALFLGLLLPACSSVHVTTDWDRQVDFSRYRTFRWAPTQTSDDVASGDRSLLDTRIRRAAVTELEARGLEHRAGSTDTDLLLVYRVHSRRRLDVYRERHHYRGRVVAVDRYREGSLVLMMVDRAQDRVVWEGAGVGVIQDADRAETVRETVAEILEDFPPS